MVRNAQGLPRFIGHPTSMSDYRAGCAMRTCSLICTMTGEAVPGDPQHSYGNIRKNGFAEAYLRENWVPVS